VPHMSVITLTSDWNNQDFYVAAVKGTIFSQNPGVQVIDISHNIRTFNTTQAAFVIRNSYKNFPEGSIHLIFVNSEAEDSDSWLIVKSEDGHYFMGNDNGIFSLILGGKSESIVKLSSPKPEINASFSSLKIFTEAASKIINGTNIEELGSRINEYKEKIPLRATIEENAITGSVIYIDSYENVITNISRDLFERIAKGRKFNIYVQSKHYKISLLSEKYHEVPSGELLALFNSINLLEIAINNGNVAQLLNLDLSSTIRIEFLNKI
jgi:S-adenosylmethionine hydrolase